MSFIPSFNQVFSPAWASKASSYEVNPKVFITKSTFDSITGSLFVWFVVGLLCPTWTTVFFSDEKGCSQSLFAEGAVFPIPWLFVSVFGHER